MTLTRLATLDDVATGSGMVAGVPDGRFTLLVDPYGFGPPVIASGGHVAFSGWVEFDTVPPNTPAIRSGVWGANNGSLSTLVVDFRSVPGGTDENLIVGGFVNVNQSGVVAFGSRSVSTNTGVISGYMWWGDTTASAYPDLEKVPDAGDNTTPLQVGPHIGVIDGIYSTNFVYNTQTKISRAISYTDMPAGTLGAGVTLTGPGDILALTEEGRMILLGAASDNTNRVLLANGPDDVVSILAVGGPAPGATNLTIRTIKSAAANERGTVVVLARLKEGNQSSFNDRSALFAGPPTNVELIAISPPQTSWDPLLLINNSNHIFGPGNNGYSIYTLPNSTNETLTITPVPDVPGENPAPSANVFCFNARDQIAELFINYTNGTGRLWLFNPGEGWTNVARAGEILEVGVPGGNASIVVTNIDIVGTSFSGIAGSSVGGSPTSLADDGKLAFTVNVRHVILADTTSNSNPGSDFYWTGLLGPNWHTVGGNPPSNWEDSTQTPRDDPPGVAEPDTATVVINAVPGETIVLDDSPTSIGSLTQSNGLLNLKEHLTLNQPSKLNDLRMQAPNGSLTVNDATGIKDFDWITGTVNGTGQLTATNLFITNATSVRLTTTLVVKSNAIIDGSTLIVSNAAFRPDKRLTVRTGAITNGGGAALVQSAALLRKEGPGNFAIHTPFQAFEPLFRVPPWGIETTNGQLSLLGGGDFNGYQTNTIHTNSTLEMTGTFEAHGEMTLFQGDGKLELGTMDNDVHLQMLPFAKVELNMGGHTANFNRGEITGELGYCANQGTFVWKGGRIAVGSEVGPTPDSGFFENIGRFEIDESAGQERHLDGGFFNDGAVEQRGDFDLNGFLENDAVWKIVRGVDIGTNNGTGYLDNFGMFNIELEAMGTVNIDADVFVDFRKGFGEIPGRFVVGRRNGANPTTVVLLRGRVFNLFAARLAHGLWQVGPNCSLRFPSDIESLDSSATVEINGGDIPELKLKQNFGTLVLQDKAYSPPSPGNLENGDSGDLVVKGASVLSVNGALDNFGRLECLAGSQIVAGDLVNKPGAALRNDGQITVNGTATLGGTITGSGQYIFPVPSVGVFQEFVYVGSSPGTLTIVGSMALAVTATLSMELAGTQTNQFDILSATGNVALNGTLAVNLLDGFRPAPGDTFPIVQAGSITGQFANATNGQRIATIDGYGSAVVNYTPTSVVLSAFQLNPNPPPTAPATMQLPTFDFDGTINLTLTGSPGRDYVFQTSTNLMDWTSVETNNASFNGLLEFELPPSSADPQRFFRALGL